MVMECLIGTVSTSILKSPSIRHLRLLHHGSVGIIGMAILIMHAPLILNAPITRYEKRRVFRFSWDTTQLLLRMNLRKKIKATYDVLCLRFV